MTGSAISLLNMLKGFKPGQVEARIIFLRNGPAVEKFRSLGFNVHVCETPGFWTTPGPRWYQRGNLENLRALLPHRRLRKLIASIKPDIIHINDKAALNAAISSWGLSIPVVQHLRSTYYICHSPVNRILSSLAIDLFADHKIAISEDEAGGLRKSNTTVIFNSVSPDDIQEAIRGKVPLNPQKIKIGWLGRFSQSKGAWDFLHLAGALQRRHNNLEFHMLAPLPGENDLERMNGQLVSSKQFLNSLVEKYNLDNSLVLHGYRPDFLSVAASMDIMVNCNRLGALGRQAFETVCLGVATVVTARYPGRSSILNREISRMVKEGDADALLEAVQELIGDESLRNRMAREGRDWGMQHFDSAAQSAKVFNLYQQLLPH